MTTLPLRKRLITAAAAASVVGAGLTGVAVTAGTGTASAADCVQDKIETITQAFVPYTFGKSVPATVGEGGTLTYSLTVSTVLPGNPYVNTIVDTPPSALTDVKPSVTVKAFSLVGGILGGGGILGDLISSNAVNPGGVIKVGDGWRVTHTGWAVFDGQALSADFSYKLPASVTKGTELWSGGAYFKASVPTQLLDGQDFPNLKVCTTVRAKNAGESILGSLDSAGLGSSDGQLSSAGSLTDMLPSLLGGAS